MEYFQVRYDSRVVIYECKMSIRLATEVRSFNLEIGIFNLPFKKKVQFIKFWSNKELIEEFCALNWFNLCRQFLENIKYQLFKWIKQFDWMFHVTWLVSANQNAFFRIEGLLYVLNNFLMLMTHGLNPKKKISSVNLSSAGLEHCDWLEKLEQPIRGRQTSEV